MLSNTAVPKYYGQFRDAVLRGEIPICHEIEMEMERIDDLIQNPNYYYDDKAVEGWINFCEKELTLVDGSDLYMLDSFKLWGEEIFGWYEFVDRSVYELDADGHSGHYIRKSIKKRLVNTQYLIVGRGAAKSIYASCLQAYFLVIDPATTDQIVTAPTMKQADETMSPIRTAIARSRGPVFKLLTYGSNQNTTGSKANRQKLYSSKKGIEDILTNSLIEIRPMSVDKLQGSRCKVATVDEWLSGDIREDVIEAIEQGASKNDDYLIVATSSEGTVRNNVGDTIKIDLQKILRGEVYNPHVSIFYYRMDSVDEIADPRLWLKANPNIDKTVTYDTYQRAVQTAETNPSKRNDILAKRFGIPCEGYTYFFTYEDTIPTKRCPGFWRMPCSLGADLSQGGDFCAFSFLFPLSPDTFGWDSINFITERTLMALPSAMREKYDQFIQEGSLFIMDGTILDMDQVYDEVDHYIVKKEYDVRCFGYDPYNAEGFVRRWITENGQWGVEKVLQGARTETVPLTEIKKLAEDHNLIFDEKIITYTMGNCIVIEDTNGNKKLYKQAYSDKIDTVAAFLDAFVAYKVNKDNFDI